MRWPRGRSAGRQRKTWRSRTGGGRPGLREARLRQRGSPKRLAGSAVLVALVLTAVPVGPSALSPAPMGAAGQAARHLRGRSSGFLRFVAGWTHLTLPPSTWWIYQQPRAPCTGLCCTYYNARIGRAPGIAVDKTNPADPSSPCYEGSGAPIGVANHQRWPSGSRASYSRCP